MFNFKLLLFAIFVLVLFAFQRGVIAQDAEPESKPKPEAEAEAEAESEAEEEEPDVMEEMMTKFTGSILKTFPSPLKMDPINLKVLVGPLANFNGQFGNVAIDGVTNTKINASNIDITEFALDITVRADSVGLSGVIDMDGYAMGIIPLGLAVNLKIGIEGVLTESIEGKGKIAIRQLVIDVFPQTLTLIVATFVVLFLTACIGYFFVMNGVTIYKKYNSNQVRLMKSDNQIG